MSIVVGKLAPESRGGRDASCHATEAKIPGAIERFGMCGFLRFHGEFQVMKRETSECTRAGPHNAFSIAQTSAARRLSGLRELQNAARIPADSGDACSPKERFLQVRSFDPKP